MVQAYNKFLDVMFIWLRKEIQNFYWGNDSPKSFKSFYCYFEIKIHGRKNVNFLTNGNNLLNH